MQEALFTIELKGHSYLFAFGNIVSVDLSDSSNGINNQAKLEFRRTRISIQNGCINRPYSYKAL